MTGAAPLQALGLSRMPSTRLPVLRPTPFCNPDCDCCDLPHRDARQRMSITRLRRAAKRLVDDGPAGKELTAIWHAGEPMAVPIEFYREASRCCPALCSLPRFGRARPGDKVSWKVGQHDTDLSGWIVVWGPSSSGVMRQMGARWSTCALWRLGTDVLQAQGSAFRSAAAEKNRKVCTWQ